MGADAVATKGVDRIAALSGNLSINIGYHPDDADGLGGLCLQRWA
jgi:hypothetical protein